MTAPAPGVDREFDEVAAKAWEAVEKGGNPQGITIPDLRETLAAKWSKHGSREFPLVDNPFLADDPAEAVIEQTVHDLHIPETPAEPYWYENPEDAAFIEHHILSRRKLGRRLQGGLLITGPAGSGKTRGAVKAVERINRDHGFDIPVLVMHCPTITDPQKWFGARHIGPKGDRYEESGFVHAVRTGATVILDEWMRVHPSIHNNVMSLFDGSESVFLADLNITIERHPQTVFIGTTNIGAAFGGTHRMDWAMRERWSWTVERDFPPQDEEVKILTINNPGCDEKAAIKLVEIAVQSRKMHATGDLRTPISTRTLDNAAFLVASGMSVGYALARTALPEYDGDADGGLGTETDRQKVAQAIEGKTGWRRR